METVITTIINGLSLGGVYAMIALGYTMVYGIAKMLNFAHGDIIMVGGYMLFVFLNKVQLFPNNPGFSVLVATAIAILACAALGITVEKLAYKPLRGASPLAVLITAIGVSYFLQSLAQSIPAFGAGFKTLSSLIELREKMGSISIGNMKIQVYTLFTLACTVLVMVALSLFVKYSKAGRAMLATSEDRGAAELMGVNVNGIITLTFIIGSVLAALAGFFTLLEKPTGLNPTFGAMPGIKAFTAAVIGGIGSIPGAMLGGVLLGLVECICNSIEGVGDYTIAIEFAILIIILLIRPNGFLGKKRREKV